MSKTKVDWVRFAGWLLYAAFIVSLVFSFIFVVVTVTDAVTN